MTAPKTPAALALAAIRPLASVTTGGVPKTVSTMRHHLDTIRTIADGVLQPPPAPVPAPTPVPVPPIPPVVPPPVIPPPVVPPVPVPVPPAPAPTPTPAPSPTGLLFADSMSYPSPSALAARLAKYPGEIYQRDLIQHDAAVTYQGQPTVRYDQPAGTARSPALWPSLPAAADDLWLRALIFFSSHYQARSHKLIGLGWEGDVKGAPTISQRATVEVDGLGYTLRAAVSAGGKSVVPFKWMHAGPLRVGAFYEHLVHYAITSPTTARLEYWNTPDGQPRGAPWTLDIAGAVRRVGFVCLALNYNDVRTVAQSLNWADVSVHAGGDPWGIGG